MATIVCDDLGGAFRIAKENREVGRLSRAEICLQIPLPTLFSVVEDNAGLL